MFTEATATPLHTCSIVWSNDGIQGIRIPATMGQPRSDQLLGRSRDKVIELAGRVCYDSLGSKNSRDSHAYHAHINETRHHSTHEHAVITVELKCSSSEYPMILECLVNQPGVWVESRPGSLRITMNLRAVREFGTFQMPGTEENWVRPSLAMILKKMAVSAAPLACGDLENSMETYWKPEHVNARARLVEPISDNELWAVLHFENVSRGLSHELVRHGDWTSISQRSTRFCAESEPEWIPHPLILRHQSVLDKFNAVQRACAPVYDEIARVLEQQLKENPASAPSARKQARGAARGVLGNALETQLIFGASIAQWKWMLRKRCSNAADAEIRLAFVDVLQCLLPEFPKQFASADWDLMGAADGIGQVVRCEG